MRGLGQRLKLNLDLGDGHGLAGLRPLLDALGKAVYFVHIGGLITCLDIFHRKILKL